MADKRCAPKPPRVGDMGPSAALFRALADPHRLHIFAMIAAAGSDACVCDINTCVPLLQPTVSHHLKVLRDCGLVIGTRRANWVYYRIADGAAERVRGALAAVFPKGVPHENASLAADRRARRKRRVLSNAARRGAIQTAR